MKKYYNYKLCYIDRGLAYFTRKKLKDQCGSFWDKIPYEHNASEPNCCDENDVVKIYFISYEYDEPCERCTNFPYSVNMINNKEVPWLEASFDNNVPPIFAGTTLKDFINMIIESGGEVFVKAVS